MVKKSALIVVDMQNDFLKGGPLAVPLADEIISTINQLLLLPFDCFIATQDWHPPKHCSFASTWNKKLCERINLHGIEQILWPDHCVQGTYGAEFSSDLDVSHFHLVVHKGREEDIDSYSTFFDNEKKRTTGLESFLKNNHIQDLFFAGVATEYCVFYSVLDALELGFSPVVISDAVRGIDLREKDIEKACHMMKERGVRFMTSQEVALYFKQKQSIIEALSATEDLSDV